MSMNVLSVLHLLAVYATTHAAACQITTPNVRLVGRLQEGVCGYLGIQYAVAGRFEPPTLFTLTETAESLHGCLRQTNNDNKITGTNDVNVVASGSGSSSNSNISSSNSSNSSSSDNSSENSGRSGSDRSDNVRRFCSEAEKPLINGENYGKLCAQKCDIGDLFCEGQGQEDCLFVNVYVPSACTDELLPVVLFWHGGAYRTGSNSGIYNGYVFSPKTCTIFVASNYRLGILGWLRFGDDIPGNQGFLDQQTALLWTKQNIHHFGGDPNRITIMGHSAGASSVWYHTANDVSAAAISSAILLSPSLGSPVKTIEESHWLALKALSESSIVQICGVPPTVLTGSYYLLYVDCLKYKVNVNKLLEASQRATVAAAITDIFWGLHSWDITIDKHLIKTDLAVPAGDISLLMTFVNDEGTFVRTTGMLDSLVSSRSLFDAYLLKAFDDHPNITALTQIYAGEAVDVSKNNILTWMNRMAKISNPFTILSPSKDSPSHRSGLQKAFGDYIYTCAGRYSARRLQNDRQPRYLFGHFRGYSWTQFLKEHYRCKPEDNVCKYFSKACSSDKMVCHGEDMPFLFQQSPRVTQGHSFTHSEVESAELLLSYISHFARNGNPNGGSLPQWPAYEEVSDLWMTIGRDSKPNVISGLNSLTCDLWDSVQSYRQTWAQHLNNSTHIRKHLLALPSAIIPSFASPSAMLSSAIMQLAVG